MDTLTVEFQPDSRLSKNGLRRGHWRESQPLIKQLREDAFVLGLVEKETGWETPERCKVDVRQFYCGRPFDWDGLAALTAPVIDGLVDCGVLPVDDSPAFVVEYAMTAERVRHRHESKVAVTVTPVSG
tara:strand:- start:182 stop:565 length:384 start_codon:yes stop_codon:yes gene_type:complete